MRSSTSGTGTSTSRSNISDDKEENPWMSVYHFNANSALSFSNTYTDKVPFTAFHICSNASSPPRSPKVAALTSPSIINKFPVLSLMYLMTPVNLVACNSCSNSSSVRTSTSFCRAPVGKSMVIHLVLLFYPATVF